MRIKLYSILVYKLLFTQALFLDVSMVLLSTVVLYSVMLWYDWWLRMVINISVQYSGGLLPDIILLTQGYYHWGTRLNTM